MTQRFGRDRLVVVLQLLSNPSCRREVGASWTDVAGTLLAGIGAPTAEVAGLVSRPLPLGELARVVVQLGCDHSVHTHVPLRVQSVQIAGGDNVLVDTAMEYHIYTYIPTARSTLPRQRGTSQRPAGDVLTAIPGGCMTPGNDSVVTSGIAWGSTFPCTAPKYSPRPPPPSNNPLPQHPPPPLPGRAIEMQELGPK